MIKKKEKKKSNHSWSEKQEEQKKVVNAINFHGYVLEDRVAEVIRATYPGTHIYSQDVFLQPKLNERIEIDVWLKHPRDFFIFEVKSSAYDWIFLKGPSMDRNFHLISDSRGCGIHVSAYPENASHPYNSDVTEVCFEVLANRSDGSTELKTQPTSNKVVGNLNVPIAPSNRDIIRSAVKQLFKNLETLIYCERNGDLDAMLCNTVRNAELHNTVNKKYFPFLITNAPLYVAEYTYDNVDVSGSLKELSTIKQVPWLAYNFAEILHWDEGLRRQIKHAGWSEGNLSRKETFTGSHLKSIFVVHYQSLSEFLKKMN